MIINGNKFRNIREFHLGLTQSECAYLFDVKLNTIQRWEAFKENKLTNLILRKCKECLIVAIDNDKDELLYEGSFYGFIESFESGLIVGNVTCVEKMQEFIKLNPETLKKEYNFLNKNKAGRDQNFLNEPIAPYGVDAIIKENENLKQEVARLNLELNKCKDKIIEFLSKK